MTSWRPGGGDLWTTLLGAVDDAARETARRAARRSVAWWRTETPAGRTREAAVTALVATLAGYEQDLSSGDDPPETYRTPPAPRRTEVLLDQLAVMAYDLMLALGEHAHGGSAAAPDPETVARLAVGECLAVAYEIDPRPVSGALLDLALPAAAGRLADVLGVLPRNR